VGVISTVPDGYAPMSGTSMACPAVTGFAVALLSRNLAIRSMPRTVERAGPWKNCCFDPLNPNGWAVSTRDAGCRRNGRDDVRAPPDRRRFASRQKDARLDLQGVSGMKVSQENTRSILPVLSAKCARVAVAESVSGVRPTTQGPFGSDSNSTERANFDSQ
jgi:hypothetical protein